MGATFKENVSDIRNSKVADLVHELQSFSVQVEVVDPHASSDELQEEYGYGLVEAPRGRYQAVVVAVNHGDYVGLPESYFTGLLAEKGLFVDVKGIYRNAGFSLNYWSL